MYDATIVSLCRVVVGVVCLQCSSVASEAFQMSSWSLYKDSCGYCVMACVVAASSGFLRPLSSNSSCKVSVNLLCFGTHVGIRLVSLCVLKNFAVTIWWSEMALWTGRMLHAVPIRLNKGEGKLVYMRSILDKP